MFLRFLPKLARTPVAVGILIASSQITRANVLVQHDTASGFTSTGYYNDKIGTTLDGTDPFFPCANVACGDPTISLSSAPNLSAASGILGNWLGNPASLNSNWTFQSIPTSWPINSETAIVYPFNTATTFTNISLLAGVDNGIVVWLDGKFVLAQEAPGTFTEWQYGPASLPNLAAGTHYLQVLREDHGGGDGFVIQLSGTPSTSTVPEPKTGFLLSSGLLVFAFVRRRVKGHVSALRCSKV